MALAVVTASCAGISTERMAAQAEYLKRIGTSVEAHWRTEFANPDGRLAPTAPKTDTTGWIERAVMVTDESGNPLAGARVRNYGIHDVEGSPTENPGQCALLVPPGPWRVQAFVEGFIPSDTSGDWDAGHGLIVVVLKPSKNRPVVVHIDWAAQGPAKGARLLLMTDPHHSFESQGKLSPTVWHTERDFGAETSFTLSNGHMTRFRIGAPEWLFVVTEDAHGGRFSKDFWRLRAEPRALVRTKLVDEDGEPWIPLDAKGRHQVTFCPLDQPNPQTEHSSTGGWIYDRLVVAPGDVGRMPQGRYLVWFIERAAEHDEPSRIAMQEVEISQGTQDLSLTFREMEVEFHSLPQASPCSQVGSIFVPCPAGLGDLTAAAALASHLDTYYLQGCMEDKSRGLERAAKFLASRSVFAHSPDSSFPAFPVFFEGKVFLPKVPGLDWHVQSADGREYRRAMLEKGTISLVDSVLSGTLVLSGNRSSLSSKEEEARADWSARLARKPRTIAKVTHYVIHLWEESDNQRTIWTRRNPAPNARKPDHVIFLKPDGVAPLSQTPDTSENNFQDLYSLPAGKYTAVLSSFTQSATWTNERYTESPHALFDRWRDNFGRATKKVETPSGTTWITEHLVHLHREPLAFEVKVGGYTTITLDDLLNSGPATPNGE